MPTSKALQISLCRLPRPIVNIERDYSQTVVEIPTQLPELFSHEVVLGVSTGDVLKTA